MGIRVVVLDDNPHVRWHGRTYPVNATFHRFLSAVLDVPGQPVGQIVHCVPLRDAREPPRALPVDERIEVVGTAPFDGIAGYLRGLPRLIRTNRPILAAALHDADLVWLKLPASNALLAAGLARRAGVPRFGYVAGSAREVAAARWTGAPGVAAAAVGTAWDVAARIATIGARRVTVGHEVVTSLVDPAEIRDPDGRPWPWEPGRLRLAWAGRLAGGKGVEQVLEALAALPQASLLVLGDGPAGQLLRSRAAALGIADRVDWRGHVADRAPYLEALASADMFVFPSAAEGFPKVVLDAMAVGLPVVARPVGSLRALASEGVYRPIRGSLGPELVDSAAAWHDIRRRGRDFVARHTRSAEAGRLAELLASCARPRTAGSGSGRVK